MLLPKIKPFPVSISIFPSIFYRFEWQNPIIIIIRHSNKWTITTTGTTSLDGPPRSTNVLCDAEISSWNYCLCFAITKCIKDCQTEFPNKILSIRRRGFGTLVTGYTYTVQSKLTNCMTTTMGVINIIFNRRKWLSFIQYSTSNIISWNELVGKVFNAFFINSSYHVWQPIFRSKIHTKSPNYSEPFQIRLWKVKQKVIIVKLIWEL